MILKKEYLWYLYFIILLSQSTVHSEATSVKSADLSSSEAVSAIPTEDAFLNALDQAKPIVIMCWMENCPHCNTIKPIFYQFAQDKKYKNISFAHANGPDLKIHKHIARETQAYEKPLKIPGYPSFIFIKDKKVVDVLIGGSEDKLKQKLRNLL